MADRRLALTFMPWDAVLPLALGSVEPDGLSLDITLAESALVDVMYDERGDGGEISFGKYLQHLAAGDRRFVALPAFVCRGFCQRYFWVRGDSDLRGFGDLAGLRVGLAYWGTTGNTWARSLVRDAGVALDEVQWVVPARRGRLDEEPPPEWVTILDEGQTVLDELEHGRLDAVVAPPAQPALARSSPFRRLVPDFRAAEEAYWSRTGLLPGHHVVALRRELVEHDPTLALRLYAALRSAREHAERTRLRFSDTSLWLVEDLERQWRLLGPAAEQDGVEPNGPMVARLCDELLDQGLLARRLAPSEAFADFAALG